jgi:type II secretory pathway pseudopilin PulG
MSTVVVVLVSILAALVGSSIIKILAERRALNQIERRGRVHDIMEAREQLRKLQTESTRSREDFKSRLESYNEKYNNKPSSSSKPTDNSGEPGSDM